MTMPRSGRSFDFVEEYRILKDRVRRLELRQPPTGGGGKMMTAHNFIVGGIVDASIYIPPARVYVPDPGEQGINQTVSLYWFYGSFCRFGNVGVDLFHIRGGVESPVNNVIPLNWDDSVRAKILGGSGEDLTVWYVLIHEFS